MSICLREFKVGRGVDSDVALLQCWVSEVLLEEDVPIKLICDCDILWIGSKLLLVVDEGGDFNYSGAWEWSKSPVMVYITDLICLLVFCWYWWFKMQTEIKICKRALSEPFCLWAVLSWERITWKWFEGSIKFGDKTGIMASWIDDALFAAFMISYSSRRRLFIFGN